MKTLLVQPPVLLDELYGDLAKAGSELAPQGLCTIATIARKNDYDVSIMDALALKMSVKATVSNILEMQPDVVGFTLYTSFLPAVQAICKELKKAYEKKGERLTVLVGGSHATITRGKVLGEYPEFDIACIGEGEETFVEILDAVRNEKDLETVKGIAYRNKDGQVVCTEKRPFITRMDDIPIPDWSLLPELKKYYHPAGDSLKRFPSAGITTSRGCEGKCYFCNPWQLGKSTRYHSAEYIHKMILDLMNNYGIRDIYIQDDTFVLNRDNVIRFCNIILDTKLDLTWACHGRADEIDKEMLCLMKQSGCWQVCLGIESGSQKILDNINKGTTVEQNFNTLEICREVGMDVKGLFMVGCFGEDKQTIQETMDFIKNVHMTDFHINFYTPMPLTTAMKLWPKYGDLDSSKGFLVASSRPSFVPFGMTEEELIAYRKELYKTFYLRPKVIFSYILKLYNFRISKKLILSAFAFFKYILRKQGQSC